MWQEMDNCAIKRTEFHLQIRKQEHNQYFRKKRQQVSILHKKQYIVKQQQNLLRHHNTFIFQQINSIIKNVQKLRRNQNNIYQFTQLWKQVVQWNDLYHSNIDKIVDEIRCAPSECLLHPVVLQMIDNIIQFIIVGTELRNLQKCNLYAVGSRQQHFGQSWLLRSRNALINLLAQDDSLLMPYMEILIKIAANRVCLLDLYENMFLVEQIPIHLKHIMLQQYIQLLTLSPIQDYQVYVKYLYYAYNVKPYPSQISMHLAVLSWLSHLWNILNLKQKQQKHTNIIKQSNDNKNCVEYSCLIIAKMVEQSEQLGYRLTQMRSLLKMMSQNINIVGQNEVINITKFILQILTKVSAYTYIICEILIQQPTLWYKIAYLLQMFGKQLKNSQCSTDMIKQTTNRFIYNPYHKVHLQILHFTLFLISNLLSIDDYCSLFIQNDLFCYVISIFVIHNVNGGYASRVYQKLKFQCCIILINIILVLLRVPSHIDCIYNLLVTSNGLEIVLQSLKCQDAKYIILNMLKIMNYFVDHEQYVAIKNCLITEPQLESRIQILCQHEDNNIRSLANLFSDKWYQQNF